VRRGSRDTNPFRPSQERDLGGDGLVQRHGRAAVERSGSAVLRVVTSSHTHGAATASRPGRDGLHSPPFVCERICALVLPLPCWWRKGGREKAWTCARARPAGYPKQGAWRGQSEADPPLLPRISKSSASSAAMTTGSAASRDALVARSTSLLGTRAHTCVRASTGVALIGPEDRHTLDLGFGGGRQSCCDRCSLPRAWR